MAMFKFTNCKRLPGRVPRKNQHQYCALEPEFIQPTFWAMVSPAFFMLQKMGSGVFCSNFQNPRVLKPPFPKQMARQDRMVATRSRGSRFKGRCELAVSLIMDQVTNEFTRPGKLAQKTMERSTIFNGKIHYFYGSCSIAFCMFIRGYHMYDYQCI